MERLTKRLHSGATQIGGLTMAEKAMQSADVCTHKNKIKTNFAKIFVSGTPDRPYFNILYFDSEDQDYHIGFSSYCLEYVFKWLSEEFEIENAVAVDDALVMHGKWIVRFDGPYKRRRCYCSNCGMHNGIGGIAKNQEKPFCPNCGAKIDRGIE